MMLRNYLGFNDPSYAAPRVDTLEAGDAQTLMDKFLELANGPLDGQDLAFLLVTGAGDGSRWAVTVGSFASAAGGVMQPYDGQNDTGMGTELSTASRLYAAMAGTATEANAKLDVIIAEAAATSPAAAQQVVVRELAGSSNGAQWLAVAITSEAVAGP